MSHQPPRPTELSRLIKAQAARLGFDLCRLVSLEEGPGEAAHADFFEAWLDAGRAGEMGYLARHGEKRRFPALLDESGEGFRSLVVLGVNYHRFDLPPDLRDDPSRGIIASYAWGDDYHEIIRPLLYEVDEAVRQASGRTSLGKGLVDTGPVLERDWAMQAGLGFTGKNCCTIHPQLGSWLFLATLLIPEAVAADPPIRARAQPPISPAQVMAGLSPDRSWGSWDLPLAAGKEATCGRCTRCLDACPTDAFVGPFHLDPLRCISYWTIEARSPIPPALRPRFGNRIFGCDICQEVCPWNSRLAERTPLLAGLAAQADRIAPPLLEGFRPDNPYWLADGAFARRFRRSPVKRAKRAGMLRNVCVALGNWGDPAALPALAQALADPAALARQHAAWAVGEILRRHRLPAAQELLTAHLATEADTSVRRELAAPLSHLPLL